MSAQTRSSRSRQPLMSAGSISTLIELPNSTPPALDSQTPLSPTLADSTADAGQRYSFPGYTLNAQIRIQAPSDELLTVQTLLDNSKPVTRAESPALDQVQDHDDNRSSSLSELEDGLDDATNSRHTSLSTDKAGGDVDTEAETERLEITPRKSYRTVDRFVNGQERSPSKLATTVSADVAQQSIDGLTTGANAALGAELFATTPNLAERSGRKRKRTASDSGEAEDGQHLKLLASKRRDSSWRARVDHKRSSEGHDTTVAIQQAAEVGDHGEVLSDEEVEERTSKKVAKTNGDRIPAHVPLGTVSGNNKGKRKGKRTRHGAIAEAADAAADAFEHQAPAASVQETKADEDETGGAGPDDQEDAALAAKTEEDFLRKRNAMDKLAVIEKRFATLRDKLYNERLQHLSHELQLLEQPNCIHPEYLKILQCIDQRRDEKIRSENVELRFKYKALENKVVAERAQILSQYRQEVRELRSDALEKLGQQWYQIQSERRRWHDEDFEYKYLYNPKRSQQILQQTAYNLEVSILSGIAKHRGFPAAPEIEGSQGPDFENDVRHMSLNLRPRARLARFTEPTLADRAAAEEQFLQQTPWANPQHPQNHAIYLDHRPPSDSPENPYKTPAVAQRIPDVHGLNGSASTIGVASNLSSLATGTSLHQNHADLEDSVVTRSSPLNRAKRQPHPQGTSGPYGVSTEEQEEDEPAPSSEPRHRHNHLPQLPSERSAGHQAFPTSAIHSSHAPNAHESPRYAPAPSAYGTPLATPRFATRQTSAPEPNQRQANVKNEEEQEPERLGTFSPHLQGLAANAAHRTDMGIHAPAVGIATGGGGTYGRWRA